MYAAKSVHVIVRLAVFDEIHEAYFSAEHTLYDNLKILCTLCGHENYLSENSIIVYDLHTHEEYSLLERLDMMHMRDESILIVI